MTGQVLLSISERCGDGRRRDVSPWYYNRSVLFPSVVFVLVIEAIADLILVPFSSSLVVFCFCCNVKCSEGGMSDDIAV